MPKHVAHVPLAVLLLAAGLAHLVSPQFFLAIMPPQLPCHAQLVALSGLAELTAGVMLLVPPWRRQGALLTAAVLIAVWPANWYHAIAGGVIDPELPRWMGDARIAWCRLPLQLPLLWWALALARPWAATVQPSGSVLGAPVGLQPHAKSSRNA
ncbi:MAG: DoxX family membrane protein [Deltaproteobacteria bacterium]|nr:DoxX family membrane protein [Nannocystaceae bacterium]